MISVRLGSVPGFLNDTADALSRGVPPSSLGFRDSEVFSVPWTSFPAAPALEFCPSADLMSQGVRFHSMQTQVRIYQSDLLSACSSFCHSRQKVCSAPGRNVVTYQLLSA